MTRRKSIMPKTRVGQETVVVVGGGFSGLSACRRLRKTYNVILIDAKEYFEYYPGILRAYLHPAEHGKLCAMYQQVCDSMDCRFIWGEVTGVLGPQRSVTVKTMAEDPQQTVQFDYCIVCSGSQYGLYMTSDTLSSASAECLWYPTFLEEVRKKQSKWGKLDERFLSGRRAHFEAELKKLMELNDKKATIVVVGAGFVGIEWATEVKYYLPDIDIVIVEARGECVSVMPPRCRQYCQRYMDKVGIRTYYDVSYGSLTDSTKGKRPSQKTLAELGVTNVERMYMAVGVRSINQFLPDDCLDAKKFAQDGAVERGGFIVCNKRMQIMHKGEEPWAGGAVFAAGNCCNIQGMRLPKNSFPGEDMAGVACHNIEVLHAKKIGKGGGCCGLCCAKKFKEIHWSLGMGLCATSLGPFDATFVAGSTEEAGSGYTVLTGCLSAKQKEFIRWSKVDQNRMGCMGLLIWHFVH